MFQKILIANRGEIAVRIIRACREMGIRSVAVCSEADREALHAQLADECVCIGPERTKDSYLKAEQILSAALATGAQAIHPGFGFLSENTRFARMCETCGIAFIGPSPDIIDCMGNKANAREQMIRAGVPVIPGSEGAVTDAETAGKEADRIGYPVIIKASAGGGGKGMRVAQGPEEFAELFRMAQQETRQAFGDDHMYMEKFLPDARHVEVQILGDRCGHAVHLGERDCSIQRRHQKMIEEAPAAFLEEELRTAIAQAAVKAAMAVGYDSAGTIEFLVEPDGSFYFMEMNTRIQVEHPVTEMVTGIDLIHQMIRIADGEPLPFTQEDICIRGHSIECRISAEDPEHGFRPGAGQISVLHLPGGNGVRVDSGLYSGCSVPPFYDSMLAKLIVHGKTRKEAADKMRSALGELVIEGIITNQDFLYDLISSDAFLNGNVRAINKELEERCAEGC